MGQEVTVPQEVHDHHTRPSAPGAHNGVSTARPMPGSTQAGTLPELTTEELVRYDRHLPLPQVGVEVKGLIDYDQFCGVVPAPATDVVAEWEITPGQLKDKLDRGEEITIIDVREPHEWQIANLARYGARLIPLGQFPQRLNDINPADDIVVHCKVGGRSAQAYEVLQQAGYTRIKNLKGGILAWADQVDRSMQKY